MDDETRAVVRDTVVREAAGLIVLTLVLWALGPGRRHLDAVRHRAGVIFSPPDPYEGQVRQFAAEVGRWDHEQAAQKNHRAGGSGPCGC